MILKLWMILCLHGRNIVMNSDNLSSTIMGWATGYDVLAISESTHLHIGSLGRRSGGTRGAWQRHSGSCLVGMTLVGIGCTCKPGWQFARPRNRAHLALLPVAAGMRRSLQSSRVPWRSSCTERSLPQLPMLAPPTKLGPWPPIASSWIPSLCSNMRLSIVTHV